MKVEDNGMERRNLGNKSLYIHSELICPDGLAPLSSAELIEPLIPSRLNPKIELINDEHKLTNTLNIAETIEPIDLTKVRRNFSYNENNAEVRKLLGIELTNTKITAFSGAIAGFVSGILVCPLDVTKTRLQAQGLQSASKKKYYNGLVGTINTIVKDEGVKGLYKGIGPILMGYLPSWMIYFSIYEFCKDSFPTVLPNSVFLSHSCSAITAGAVSTVLTNPIWVIKTRLMLQNGISRNSTHYRNTFDAFKKIYRQEGLKAFYAGLIPSFFGLFHVAIQFPVFEHLKVSFKYKTINHPALTSNSETDPTKKTIQAKEEYTIHPGRLILASCLSKMIASVITYPHEILRTRMQLKSSLPASVQRKIIPLIKTTYSKEGFSGFYSGFYVNLLRTVPTSVITLVTFEYVQKFLH